MKSFGLVITTAALAMVFSSPPASAADCLPFSNLGSDGTFLNSPISCTDGSGGGVTITAPTAPTGAAGQFEILIEGTDWGGEFAPGTFLLFDNNLPGAVTVTFANPNTSLDHFSIQANASGAYMATVNAFLSSVLVGTDSYSANNNGVEGTIPSFSLSIPGGYDTLVFSTTNDTNGFALGVDPQSNSVPEPLTLSILGAGLAGAVAMRRRKK